MVEVHTSYSARLRIVRIACLRERLAGVLSFWRVVSAGIMAFSVPLFVCVCVCVRMRMWMCMCKECERGRN